MTKPRKRNPQDSTLRNVRSATRRIAALEREVGNLREALEYLAEHVLPNSASMHALTKILEAK